MSNFILVTPVRNREVPIRVNAEKISSLEPTTDPEGTRILVDGNVLRVEEDINTILFRITQGEKQ